MTEENRNTLMKLMGGITIACLILASVSKCQVGTKEAEAAVLIENGEALAAEFIEAKERIRADSVRLQALRDTTDVLRASMPAKVAEAEEAVAEVTQQVDEAVDEIEAVAGDSIAVVEAVVMLREQLDSMSVAHTAEVIVWRTDYDIVWRRVEATDERLASQILLTNKAEEAMVTFQAGANRAMDALRAIHRRDGYIKIAVGVGFGVAVWRAVTGS